MINLAVIPARGGSKGIPKKNICMIAGKPLIVWTIEAALKSKSIDRVVVSSEDEDIMEIVAEFGVDVRNRPIDLAQDNIHAINVVIDCLKFYEEKGIIIDKVSMLLPTSPLRTAEDIDKAHEIFAHYNTGSVVGVVKSNKPVSNYRYIDHTFKLVPIINTNEYEVQRQDIVQPVFEVNGAMFVATAAHVRSFESFHKGAPSPYIMTKRNSIDINDMDDFKLAEFFLEGAMECKK